GIEPLGDRIVFAPQHAYRRVGHDALALGNTASRAIFSLAFSSWLVLSTMIVRPSFTRSPLMYSAARPFTTLDGWVICDAATWSTSVTASTTTPIFAPSDSRITVRVSSR